MTPTEHELAKLTSQVEVMSNEVKHLASAIRDMKNEVARKPGIDSVIVKIDEKLREQMVVCEKRSFGIDRKWQITIISSAVIAVTSTVIKFFT